MVKPLELFFPKRRWEDVEVRDVKERTRVRCKRKVLNAEHCWSPRGQYGDGSPYGDGGQAPASHLLYGAEELSYVDAQRLPDEMYGQVPHLLQGRAIKPVRQGKARIETSVRYESERAAPRGRAAELPCQRGRAFSPRGDSGNIFVPSTLDCNDDFTASRRRGAPNGTRAKSCAASYHTAAPSCDQGFDPACTAPHPYSGLPGFRRQQIYPHQHWTTTTADRW
ncbi:hypothetical protein DIPPA_02973 [Diplonema papillatum]|nr:hypothetical protein DIPPA_02973 [Diplonema papillatum]